MSHKKKIIVVGAGIAGLTLSFKLSAAGHEILLVEKADAVGGLAKNFEYEGGYFFDPGPHRFYTENPDVSDFIYEVLDDDVLHIGRKSGVRMFDRYFDWPLEATAIFRMPLAVLLSVASDLFKKDGRGGPSFEEYILSRYGETLYRIFFKPYTEKFLGLPCAKISNDWAVTGIDRAILDKKLDIQDLFSLAKSLFFSAPPLRFMYPKSGGIGVFSEKLRKKIIDHNGMLLLKSEITAIESRNGLIKKIVVGDREYECDMLVWTGSLLDAADLLAITKPDLQYLSILIYNYCLDTTASCPYQWCYFGSADVPFNRVSIPTLFNPSLAPKGKSGVCAEVTCRRGDLLWNVPETIEPRIRQALLQNKIIRKDSVESLHIEKLANAYPIYTLDYAEKLSQTLSETRRFRNLRMLGRTGMFWYNNMDHSIEAALRLYNEIDR